MIRAGTLALVSHADHYKRGMWAKFRPVSSNHSYDSLSLSLSLCGLACARQMHCVTCGRLLHASLIFIHFAFSLYVILLSFPSHPPIPPPNHRFSVCFVLFFLWILVTLFYPELLLLLLFPLLYCCCSCWFICCCCCRCNCCCRCCCWC